MCGTLVDIYSGTGSVQKFQAVAWCGMLQTPTCRCKNLVLWNAAAAGASADPVLLGGAPTVKGAAMTPCTGSRGRQVCTEGELGGTVDKSNDPVLGFCEAC